MDRNFISKNTKIIGEIKSDGDFRIDGEFEGDLITSGKIILGNEGVLNGTVQANFAEIQGVFTGKLTIINTLTVQSTANISGDITVGKLSVEPGGLFNATCVMKAPEFEVKIENENPQKKLRTIF